MRCYFYASCSIPISGFNKVTHFTLMYKTPFLSYIAFILSYCLLNNCDLRNWGVQFWYAGTKSMLFYDILWDLHCSGGKCSQPLSVYLCYELTFPVYYSLRYCNQVTDLHPIKCWTEVYESPLCYWMLYISAL